MAKPISPDPRIVTAPESRTSMLDAIRKHSDTPPVAVAAPAVPTASVTAPLPVIPKVTVPKPRAGVVGMGGMVEPPQRTWAQAHPDLPNKEYLRSLGYNLADLEGATEETISAAAHHDYAKQKATPVDNKEYLFSRGIFQEELDRMTPEEASKAAKVQRGKDASMPEGFEYAQPHKESWGELATRLHRAYREPALKAGIVEATEAEKALPTDAVRKRLDQVLAVHRASAEKEAESVASQLSTPANEVKISMVDLGSKYGVDLSKLENTLSNDYLKRRVKKEYPTASVDTVEAAMKEAGVVDPAALRQEWAAQALKDARTRIGMAFAGKKHLTAITTDSKALRKHLAEEYDQRTIADRTNPTKAAFHALPEGAFPGSDFLKGKVAAFPSYIGSLVPIPWATADIAAVVAPKEFTVFVPGGIDQRLTAKEVRGEEWGDHIPRVAFDLTAGTMAARYLTWRDKHGGEIAAQALPSIGQSVSDGDVRGAFQTYIDASAAAQGYAKTQEDKEAYIDLLRTNPNFMDILKKEWESLFVETWDSVSGGKPMPPGMLLKAQTIGYINGLAVHLVAPDPVALLTLGTGGAVSKGFKFYRLRQADKFVENTKRLVALPETTPTLVTASNKLISPAIAEHQQTVMAAASRSNAGSGQGIAQLESDAAKLLDRADELRKAAGEHPATVEEAVKKAKAASQAVADEAAALAAGKAARLKGAQAGAQKAVKVSEADRMTAEAVDTLEQAQLIRTEDALVDSRKALEDYATNNDPMKKAVEKAYREAATIERQTVAAQAALKKFTDDNIDVIDEIAPTMVAAGERAAAVTPLRKEYDILVATETKAKEALQEATENLQKALKSAVTPPGGKAPKLPPKVRATVKQTADDLATALKNTLEQKKLLAQARVEARAADKVVAALTPTQRAVWRRTLALGDTVADAAVRKGANEAVLKGLFGDGVPEAMLAADKLMRKHLADTYEAAKIARAAQVAKAGGTAKALEKAAKGREKAEELLKAAKAARAGHASQTAAASVTHTTQAAADVAAVEAKGAARGAKLTEQAEVTARNAASMREQSQAWRSAAVHAAEQYRDGLRLAPNIRQAARETQTTKKLITEGLLRPTSNKVGFLVDVPGVLKNLRMTIGDGGIKWLSEQATDTGQVVKKLTEAIGGLQLSPAEVRALEQSVEALNNARVMGHAKKEALLTYNTVRGLEAIEHTKSNISWMKKVVGVVAQWGRAFDNNAIKLGTIDPNVLPQIARAAANKGIQAQDELAFIKTRGGWSDVSEYGKAAVRKLGLDAVKGTEGATQMGLMFDYLGTTNPVRYSSGGTLLNTSTITGKNLFEQFRAQALTDVRVSEFLAEARKADSDEALDIILKKYDDTVAPYLVGVSRVWFPMLSEKVDPQTANAILNDMMALLRKSDEEGTDLVDFVVKLKARTERAPAVGVTQELVGGGVRHTTLRPTSSAGVGGSDKDVVRVMGFLGDLVAHGSNLYEVEHMLTKLMGGVIDPTTMKHVDLFITGRFRGADAEPLDIPRVMEFFNRMGLPMTSDKFLIKDWAGQIGERVVRLQALQNDPNVASWVTHDLVKSLDENLSKVVKTLEASTRKDMVPGTSIAYNMANLWRRGITVGLTAPRPAFWVGNYLGNIYQTWTVLGIDKAAQVGVTDFLTNIPGVGRMAQDALSRQSLRAQGKPVLGPMMNWLFNPHVDGVMSGKNGFITLKNGAIIDYATLRREMVEQGVVDTMLREDLSTVFARAAQKGWWNKVSRVFWAKTDYHRAISDFQTMAQQRSRANLYLRLRDEGHSMAEAGRLLNDALFDWKHGAPAIASLMGILPFWRFFALGHRQAFRAQMQGFYDTKGALRGLLGDSQMGRLRQQRIFIQEIEKTFLPEQQGPYASLEEREMAAAALLDPIWNHDKVRLGLERLPDSVRQTIMRDTGRDMEYAMYSMWKPTGLAFMDTHFGFLGAVSAEAYASAYGGTVEGRGMGALGEVISDSVDDTMPWIAPHLHHVMNTIGLDPYGGQSGDSAWASATQTDLLLKLAASTGLDTDGMLWRPKDGEGRYRISSAGSILSMLPWANEILPHYARVALNPYRLENDPDAVKAVSFAISQMAGFGPTFYNPEDTIEAARRDTRARLGRVVPEKAKEQHEGTAEEHAPIDYSSLDREPLSR